MRIIVCALCVGLVSGCAIMGRQQKENPISAENVAKITKGMPKARVQEILGAPQDIIFSHKEHDPIREHAYVYEHVVAKYTGITFLILSFGNADEKKDRVLVFFDDTGNVESIGHALHAADASYGFPFGS